MRSFYLVFVCFVLIYTLNLVHAVDQNAKAKKKRDPIDYTEDDVNKLFEEWEKNDEDQSKEDEEAEWKYRNKEPLVGTDPDKLFARMKRGQATLIVAIVTGNPTKRETEEIASIWWMALRNALYDVHKFVVDNKQIVFGIDDGSRAYEIKDYLIKQRRCFEVTIDKQVFPGRGSKTPKFTLKEL
ncbi:hypothetical protein I4U23_000650 [Adineta vaga]|nr:hypothetical protein I4U23_000650 [Adineta vaga]